MKRLFFTAILAVIAAIGNVASAGPVVTTYPPIVQRSSQPIIITFHADEGSGGLKGLTSEQAVYAHTGVIIKGNDQWQKAPNWLDNSDKYKLAYVGPNTWQLVIPSIDKYYGTKASDEVIALAFVFRNAAGTREGKTSSGGDIMVKVEPDGFAIELSADIPSTILTYPEMVPFTLYATSAANLAIYAGDTSTTPIATATDSTELTADYDLTTPGVTTITAVATDSKGNTATQSIDLFLVGEPEDADYPGGGAPQMGTVTNADGSVTFCIAAPAKESALLVGSWNDYALVNNQAMKLAVYEGGDYFWCTVPSIADGKDYLYYYIVDGSVSVGDPYAHLILDPSNDKYIPASTFPNMPEYPSAYVDGVPLAIYNSTMHDYDWQVKNFKGVPQSQLIVYELLIRDFTGREGASSASGTIAGVMDKLDYIQSLGVNAIELLPIMEFNGNNSWGYNTNFYFAPDKQYGTPDDYRALIDECHKRGMAVILDIVFNQSDGKHPWYQMYKITENPFYNGTAPHSYSVLNDWNQDNDLVQQQWKDAVKYWMKEYKVDGYRFDLVKGLGSNQSYKATFNATTNTWSNVTEAKTNAYNASRVARMKEIHDAMREVNPDAYFINEDLAGAQEENAMAKDAEINWANINEAACQFAMGYASDSNLNRFYAPRDSRTWGSTVSYAESHDEERMAYKVAKWGEEGVKGNTPMTMRRLGSVAAQMLVTPGAHMIWQFQEFGADQTTKHEDGGNDTSPKKVIWNYLNDPDRKGLKDNYAELCAIRAANPDLFVQGVNTVMNCDSKDWNAGRTIVVGNNDKGLWLVVNPTVSSTLTVQMPGASADVDYQLLSASYGTTPTRNGTSVTLLPGAYALYGTPNISTSAPLIEESAMPFDITVVAGAIYVNGTYTNAAAYTLAGTSAPIGATLTPGLYIVVVDGHPFKVLI